MYTFIFLLLKVFILNLLTQHVRRLQQELGRCLLKLRHTLR